MLVLKIKGKNISKFIKRMYDNKIKLYKIKKINENEINIYINKIDYERIIKLKTIYEVELINKTGILKIEENIKKNIFLIISLIISIITIYLLSKIIFKVEIITNNKKLKEELKIELKENGISIYKIQKNYNELTKIKTKIMDKYRNNIEWLEIENKGTKCIIKLEERIKQNEEQEKSKTNIVSAKDAIIMSIEASSGIILKRKGESVKKGEVIISGKINLNDEVKEVIEAKGKVMGEVWYKTKVSYPLAYYEEKLTGKKYTRFTLYLFNKEINLFRKKGKIERKNIIKSNIFKLYKDTIYEVEIIDNIYNYDEAIEKALELGRKNIKSKLNDEEHIIYEKCLKVSLNDSKIELEIFYAVYENITAYERIEENG